MEEIEPTNRAASFEGVGYEPERAADKTTNPDLGAAAIYRALVDGTEEESEGVEAANGQPISIPVPETTDVVDEGKSENSENTVDLSNQIEITKGSNGERKFFVSPEASSAISDFILKQYPGAPEGWVITSDLEEELGLEPGKIESIFTSMGEDYSQHIGRFRQDTSVKLFVSPSAISAIRDDLDSRNNEMGSGIVDAETPQQEQARLETEASTFLKAVKENYDETGETQEFQKLISLLGHEKASDILYHFRPDCTRLPMPTVNKILAEYLGDFLPTTGTLNFESLESGIKLLENENLKEALGEVIKQYCLREYNDAKLDDPEADDLGLMANAISTIRDETIGYENEHMNDLLYELEDYYLSLFDIVMPEQLKERLQKNRMFPDINQLINIKELEAKKRLLIADDMGLGKSASAIASKEYLGANTALVLVPSNVIPTWETYLSDKTDDNGDNTGYFKPGNAPNVLVVDNKEQLDDIAISDYDYVLLSIEKMNHKYREALSRHSFDMLIVDEVHKFKNRNGRRSDALIQLNTDLFSDKDKYVALLSGTPIPNTVADIVVLLKLLYPDKEFSKLNNRQVTKKILKGDSLDVRALLTRRMQIKSLRESIPMPELEENPEWLELSEQEQEIYEILLEEDELTATEKLHLLRKFLINPSLLEATPDVESTKINAVGKALCKAFQQDNKVVLFFNGYITDVIRSDSDELVYEKFKLTDDVDIYQIDGSTPHAERIKIQEKLKASTGKILVLVSGQTSDVGVDFSGARAVMFYNEPWTEYDRQQQQGRVYRYGQQNNVQSTSFITKGTIEEGIRRFVREKYRAIEKILHGIPLKDIEKDMLTADEKGMDAALEVDSELASFYFSSWERMMKIFGHVRELGEEKFVRFLQEHGEEYASNYKNMGGRSYQANASRLAGTLITEFIEEKDGDIDDTDTLEILDLASGPEMLKRHSTEALRDKIVSIDINQHHFSKQGKNRAIASFSQVPLKDSSVKYVNLSLALHYTQFIPSKKKFERLAVLQEINRVLQPGGRAVITLMHTSDLKDPEAFARAVEKLGFMVVDDSSGFVQSKDNFKSRLITLEKTTEGPRNTEEALAIIEPAELQGLKFTRTKHSMRDSRKIITQFNIDGKRNIRARLNNDDQKVLKEETELLSMMSLLAKKYSEIKMIPAEEILSRGFSRIFNGKRYILFKRLSNTPGAVIFKDN